MLKWKRISKENEFKDGFVYQYNEYNQKLFEGEYLNS